MKRSVRFSPSRMRLLYLIGVTIWLSGGLWLVCHYFLTKQGEFGPQSNPLEPWFLKLHGAAAFASIWFFGILWGTHVTVAWPTKRRRLSGGVLVAVISWLIVSGFLLYYVGNETARSIVSISHWTIGLTCPLLYCIHRLKRKSAKRIMQLAQDQI